MSIAFSSSAVDDTECLEEALREYRESSWDDRDFVNRPPVTTSHPAKGKKRSKSVGIDCTWLLRQIVAAPPKKCLLLSLYLFRQFLYV